MLIAREWAANTLTPLAVPAVGCVVSARVSGYFVARHYPCSGITLSPWYFGVAANALSAAISSSWSALA